MCGICGVVKKDPVNDADIQSVKKMNQALFHRGPDSDGYFMDSHIALAMRRLKIIDLSGGDQPLYNEDSSLILIANGEIYNYVELRKELEQKGHIFKTRSDCETILHLYEEKGERCLNDLRGMFAFALYDKWQKKLLVARDRLGEKPIYYYQNESIVVFSSEMKSLVLYLQAKDFKIDYNSLNMYFHYQFVPEPLTCIEGVFKLPAAHYMTVELQCFSVSVEKYWDLEDVQPVSGNPALMIREMFDELSKVIVRADVQVGIALSGGIDSGAIAAFASKYYSERMHVFSVGYPGRPENDERDMAKKLANKLGLTYHDVELTTNHFVEIFPQLVYYMDDPIADIAAFGYYSVNKHAMECGVPVLLSGLAGDELFWGYGWVRKAVEENIVKHNLRNKDSKQINIFFLLSAVLSNISRRQMLLNPIGTLKHISKQVKYEKLKFLNNEDRYILYEKVPDFLSAFDYKASLYTDEYNAQIDDNLLYSFFTDEDWNEIPIKVCKFLFETWLYSNCVALGDRMSMASSIENRLPFLDYRFVELIMGLRKAHGNDYKLGYKKWFIDAMKNIIPDEVLNRKKRGFTPPLHEWYMAIVERYGEICYDGQLVSDGVMIKDRLIEFIENAKQGKGNLFFAYKIILFEMWFRKMQSQQISN